MTTLQLYSAKACPFAHRTRLVLGEKGVDFELTEIDLQNKPDWFGQISRYGKVPAIRHNDVEVYESVIINEYLEEVFPEPALLPKDPGDRAIARIWIDYANSRFVPAYSKLLRGDTPEVQAEGQQDLLTALHYIETHGLAHNSTEVPYWLGDRPTLVDFTFYPWFERLPVLEEFRQFVIPSELTHLRHWRTALQQRSAVKAIANPIPFYQERYARFKPVPAQVA